MTADFSFSTLLRELDDGSSSDARGSFPTQEHMGRVMRAYIENINNPDPSFAEKYLAPNGTGEDPVGSRATADSAAPQTFATALERLIDVPFTPKKAELVAPISFSLENKAAMAFKFWAEVDGRDLSIDIVDVMTFDQSGKICNIMAYWGPDNVTLLDSPGEP